MAVVNIRCLIITLAAFGLIFSASAQTRDTCDTPNGDYVVINVKSDDPIGGLAVRSSPSAKGQRYGAIPSYGVGVAIDSCQATGWCKVKYGCLEGWSLLAKYLAPEAKRLMRVVAVSPSDLDGLNVRSGPGPSYSRSGSIPFNGSKLILHNCETSVADGSLWCLVTYRSNSGWVAGRFLSPMDAIISSVPPAAPGPEPVRKPTPLPPPGLGSRGCQLFPDLC